MLSQLPNVEYYPKWSTNAVRYTAGFVIRKLIEKSKFDAEKSDILKGFLKDKSSIDDSKDSSEQWLKTSDRGGLKLVTDLAFELFVEIEVLVYDGIKLNEFGDDIDKLVQKVSEDSDILRVREECVVDAQEDQMSLLNSVIKDWITIRGHSMASSEMEKQKRAVSMKKRGLRKELKKQKLDNNA